MVRSGGVSRCGSLENSAKSGNLHLVLVAPRHNRPSVCLSLRAACGTAPCLPTECSKCDDGTEDCAPSEPWHLIPLETRTTPDDRGIGGRSLPGSRCNPPWDLCRVQGSTRESTFLAGLGPFLAERSRTPEGDGAIPVRCRAVAACEYSAMIAGHPRWI